jgi:hypothetical protein
LNADHRVEPYCGSKQERLSIPVLPATAPVPRRQLDLCSEAHDLELYL